MSSKLNKVLIKEGIKKSQLRAASELSSSTIYKAASGKLIPSLTTQNLIVIKLNELIGENRYKRKDIFSEEE